MIELLKKLEASWEALPEATRNDLEKVWSSIIAHQIAGLFGAITLKRASGGRLTYWQSYRILKLVSLTAHLTGRGFLMGRNSGQDFWDKLESIRLDLKRLQQQ